MRAVIRTLDWPWLHRIGAVETVFSLAGGLLSAYGLLNKLGLVGGTATLSLALIVVGLAAIVAALVIAKRRDDEKAQQIQELLAAEKRREAEERVRGSSATLISRRADGPIETAFLTREATGREIRLEARVVAIRLSPGAYGPSFERVTVREVPTEVDVGDGGKIVVQAFTEHGITVDEENTLGQTITLEGYPVATPKATPTPKLDFEAVLPRRNALMEAHKNQLRAQREPIMERLRTAAGRIEDHVDARAAAAPRLERPTNINRMIQEATAINNPNQEQHRKRLAKYNRDTLATYYLTHRQEAGDAMEAAQRLGLATDGQVAEVRKPDTVSKLAALPRTLRETADLLAVRT
jgi:hypothetical protein